MNDDDIASPALQGLTQFLEAFMDEFDPAVRPGRQRIEDFTVENEGAIDLPGRDEGVMQAGVVVVAKVAAEPEKAAVVGGQGCS